MMALGLAGKLDNPAGEAKNAAAAQAGAIWNSRRERAAAVHLGRLVFCIIYGPPSGPPDRPDQLSRAAAPVKPTPPARPALYTEPPAAERHGL
ncbi:MAG: hypothetical protein ACOZHQ_14755 [Thermodesulfobacteriota bacterium]